MTTEFVPGLTGMLQPKTNNRFRVLFQCAVPENTADAEIEGIEKHVNAFTSQVVSVKMPKRSYVRTGLPPNFISMSGALEITFEDDEKNKLVRALEFASRTVMNVVVQMMDHEDRELVKYVFRSVSVNSSEYLPLDYASTDSAKIAVAFDYVSTHYSIEGK